MNRNVYLNTFTLEEAWNQFQKAFNLKALTTTERVRVPESLGRVTSTPVFAATSNPHYNASAMDGIAVRSEDTTGVHERACKKLLLHEDYEVVDTGDPIPEGFDAVIMIEDVVFDEEGLAEISEAAYPFEHVRVVGEDIVIGEMIIPSQHTVRAVDIGAMLSGGIEYVDVFRQPRVGVLATGTEIVNPGTPLQPGDIIDSNSYVFSALVTEAGGIPMRYDPVIDDRELLKAAILRGVAENDMLIINAGSSAGRDDHTASLIGELGTVFVHGLSIKPGRPTILGKINDKPVVGIPGYPVSAYLVFKAFVQPMVESLAHAAIKPKEVIKAVLSKRIVSSLKNEEYIRMKLGKVGGRWIGTPLNRGAGTTMSLVKADGLLIVPRTSEGYEAGETINVELSKPKEELDRTLVVIGSHDILLDYMNDALITGNEGFGISSAHVGSLGGIMAIKRMETHIAPIHLLDTETGIYNVSAIHKYLKGQGSVLIKGIKRQQGFYVLKGNPLNISGLHDIARKQLVFANRQKGSGTRVLLEYLLKTEGLQSQEIIGYEQELLTHTSVALAVLAGNAAVGIGIESVALLMGLDFIPIGEEDYDFLVPKAFFAEDKVQAFMQYLKSPAFSDMLSALGGYRLEAVQAIEIE